MKPDWKDAPEWAQWLAMDKNGDWYWYENKPILRNVTWKIDGGHVKEAIPCISMWDKSLEQRP